MKEIKLKNLSIIDWRGQSRKLEFTNNASISGRNKSGKSTILNAFLWLLMGVDAEGRSNYQLFDNRVEQTKENSKKAIVEATITINGIEYVLKRTAEVGWVRKRGNSEYERKGSDTYKFYIDDIERSATDYKSFIEEQLAPMDKLAIMLNIQHFLSLDWKQMRKYLEDLIGEIKDEDFSGDYSSIKDLMKKFNGNIDDIRASIKPKIKVLKENVGTGERKGKLGISIEVIKDNLPDISNLESLKEEIEDDKKQIRDIDEKILCSNESMEKEIARRKSVLEEIKQLQSSYESLEEAYNREQKAKESLVSNEIEKINHQNEETKRSHAIKKEAFKYAKSYLEKEENRLVKLKEYRLQLLEKNNAIKALKFTDDKCSYCGQLLPESMIESNKKDFEKLKASKRESVLAEGKSNNVKIKECEKNIESYKKTIETGIEDINLESTKELEAKLDDLRASFVKYEETIKGKELISEIEEKRLSLNSAEEVDNKNLLNMKKQLLEEVESKSKELGLVVEYSRQIDKIKELETQLKCSAFELASLEGVLNTLNQYEREKSAIVSFRVNRLFEFVKIEMTDIDKSGNIIDACKVLDNNGVDCTCTNFASKVMAGIDISNAFGRFYGVNLPLFIDFAESISNDNFLICERQMIKLIVSNEDFKIENE